VVLRRALVLHTWEATGSNFSRQIRYPHRYYSWFFSVPALPCHSDKNYVESREDKKNQSLVFDLWCFCFLYTVFGTRLINGEATHLEVMRGSESAEYVCTPWIVAERRRRMCGKSNVLVTSPNLVFVCVCVFVTQHSDLQVATTILAAIF
jgi:hypothetical protein